MTSIVDRLAEIQAAQSALQERMERMEPATTGNATGLQGILLNEELRLLSEEWDKLAGTFEKQPYGPLLSESKRLRVIGVRLDRWSAELLDLAEAVPEIPADIREKVRELQKSHDFLSLPLFRFADAPSR